MQSITSHFTRPKVVTGFENVKQERQYWVKMLADKVEEQKKRDNLYRFWKWKGKKVNPKFIKREEMEEFKKEKLPKDKAYMKPWEYRTYAIKLGHVKTKDLSYFYDECMRADDSKNGYNFMIHFFHSLKVAKK